MRAARAFLAGLALLAAPAAAQPAGPDPAETPPAAAPEAADLRPVRARDVFPYWRDYAALDPSERDAFALRYRVIGADGEPGGVDLWTSGEEGGLHRLDADAQGYVSPPAPEVLEADGHLWTSAPPGSAEVTMMVVPAIAPSETMDAAALVAALAQASNAVRRRAGVMALFTPDFRTVVMRFDGPAPDGWAVMADGSRRPLVAEQDTLRFTPRHRRHRGAIRIELDARPQSMALMPG
jgi:hypothetical protein